MKCYFVDQVEDASVLVSAARFIEKWFHCFTPRSDIERNRCDRWPISDGGHLKSVRNKRSYYGMDYTIVGGAQDKTSWRQSLSRWIKSTKRAVPRKRVLPIGSQMCNESCHLYIDLEDALKNICDHGWEMIHFLFQHLIPKKKSSSKSIFQLW